jgi:hypothetical protein
MILDLTPMRIYAAGQNADGSLGAWGLAGSLPDASFPPPSVTDTATTVIYAFSNGAYVFAETYQCPPSTPGCGAAQATIYDIAAPINSNGTIGNWVINSTRSAIPIASDPNCYLGPTYRGKISASAGAAAQPDFASGDPAVCVVPITGGQLGPGVPTPVPFIGGFDILGIHNGFVYAWADQGAGTTRLLFGKLNSSNAVDAWSDTAAFPEPVQGNDAIIGDWIYVFGQAAAATGGAAVVTAHLNADGTAGPWGTTTPPPEPLLGPGVAVAGSYLYSLGGGSSGGGIGSSAVYSAKIE